MYIFVEVIAVIIILELLIMFIVKNLRKQFQWLITSEDERPKLDPEGLKRFIKHGYDPELGWVRKPDTEHPEKGKHGETSYHIDKIGARCNPGHEHLEPQISCFGDSFSFCRQVNDNETWQWYLSEIAGVGVLNFAVGNYGIDQGYLRMAREIDKVKTDIVILGVVPSTIVRILCVWKHYNEFGNTFGFKPRFDIKDGKLVLIKNVIDEESKFNEYENYLGDIQDKDYFYRTKFRDEMIRFPCLFHTLKKPSRNLPLIGMLLFSKLFDKDGVMNERIRNYCLMKIMNINKILRYRLFQDKYAKDIFIGIVDKFIELAKRKNFKPVFLLTPQKDDILFIKQKGHYYNHLIEKIKERVFTIDITEQLLSAKNLDRLYSDDYAYGGHYNRVGNKLVADFIYKALKENQYLNKRTEEEASFNKI